MSVAFAQCLGVPYKQDQAKISLYPCNKKSEFQKWECRNSSLAIQGEDLFLSAGKRKKDNIVLNKVSGTTNKWKIHGTRDDLCSQGHEGNVWRLILTLSCTSLPSQTSFISAPLSLSSCSPWSNVGWSDHTLRLPFLIPPSRDAEVLGYRVEKKKKKVIFSSISLL